MSNIPTFVRVNGPHVYPDAAADSAYSYSVLSCPKCGKYPQFNIDERGASVKVKHYCSDGVVRFNVTGGVEDAVGQWNGRCRKGDPGEDKAGQSTQYLKRDSDGVHEWGAGGDFDSAPCPVCGHYPEYMWDTTLKRGGYRCPKCNASFDEDGYIWLIDAVERADEFAAVVDRWNNRCKEGRDWKNMSTRDKMLRYISGDSPPEAIQVRHK